MAATMATVATLNVKCLNQIKLANPKLASKPTSLLSIRKPAPSESSSSINMSSSIAGTAIAGAIFSALSNCNAALAAQQIAEIAADQGDNRGLALLIPIIPAIAWVLFNILQPALNQLNRMRSSKGVIVGLGLGLGGLAAISIPDASASEIAIIADAASATASDNRGTLLLFVVAPAIAWVLYNILQPALNQINRMRSQ